MGVIQVLLVFAIVVILVLLFVLLLPHIRKRFSNTPDDNLEIQSISHPFGFNESPEIPINELIVEAVNRMGGTGDNADAEYQASIERLKSTGGKAVPIIVSEYGNLPESHYLDRWSLVQLLTDLQLPEALSALDEILSDPIPPEQSRNPHSYSTVGKEILIRTTAVEAITRIAQEGNSRALDLLLKHTFHENFSVKRASIQGYLTHGGDTARQILLRRLPEKDHYILEINREDIGNIPQPRGENFLKHPETGDHPRIPSPIKPAR